MRKRVIREEKKKSGKKPGGEGEENSTSEGEKREENGEIVQTVNACIHVRRHIA
jgi:hypothetical protein